MKFAFKFIALAFAVLAIGMSISCSDNDNDFTWEEEREKALSSAATTFVDKTVIPTYHNLANAAIELADLCAEIEQSANENSATDIASSGTLSTATQALITQACEKWYDARKYWELSEAFLYGPASDYSIDPHIDSWPLNATELQALLNDDARMSKMDAEYAGAYLGYGLLGFHAVEYMIFDLTANKSELKGKIRTAPYKRKEELTYLSAVAGDLANQCVRLEASWAGMDHISAAKQTMLEDAELEPSFDYGASMRNSGKGGSKYKSYLEAAQEIIQGCADIADEVANQKINRPNTGTSGADISYIESPYAKNSKQDFYDNIVSIRNAYEGANANDVSVSDYLKTIDAAADKAVRDAIAVSMDAIDAAPAPFVNYAGTSNALWKKATDECNALKRKLDAAQTAIGQ